MELDWIIFAEFIRYTVVKGSGASSSIYIPGTRGASPRWADARLGSAHARNYRGCIIGKIEGVNATVLPRSTLKKNRV